MQLDQQLVCLLNREIFSFLPLDLCNCIKALSLLHVTFFIKPITDFFVPNIFLSLVCFLTLLESRVTKD